MSRTHKDVTSVRALTKEAIKRGLIHHDHSRMGMIVSRYRRRDDLSGCFLTRNKKDIDNYASYLSSIPKIVFDITEINIYSEHSFFCDDIFSKEGRHKGCKIAEKLTFFNVKEERITAYTNYCFSAEHYDIENKKDTRDGGLATCTPDVYSLNTNLSKRWLCRGERKETSRKTVKQSLRAIAVEYNTDPDDIENDNYHFNTILEVQYGKKTYTSCC